jgi:uncharacterized phage infection (PIP) family protein YhgE
MPTRPAAPAAPSRTLHVLDTALDKSHEVKAEVEAVAEDVGSANDHVEAQLAGGASTLPAAEALANGLAVEQRIQECADDLDEVTATLARGIADIKQVEIALTRSRVALAEA